VTPADFARELAAVLAASLPAGFSAEADGALVTVVTPDGTGATTALDLEGSEADDLDAYADAAEAVLSLAQDLVCESLDTPWPTASGASVDLPIPGARVEGGSLRLWYGDDDAPVLTLRAVPL
jgi:hypothetical protein